MGYGLLMYIEGRVYKNNCVSSCWSFLVKYLSDAYHEMKGECERLCVDKSHAINLFDYLLL